VLAAGLAVKQTPLKLDGTLSREDRKIKIIE
jgi:hypothetical protein